MKDMVVMLVVSDIEKSVEFYNKLFGLQIVADFGANKTLTGGLALQTQETYKKFIENDTISYGGNNFELYFEVDDFDNFVDKLSGFDIVYVHSIKTHSWGQRVIRFYDLDRNIIEVGENMKTVCQRFLDSGMTPEQVASRMDVPIQYIHDCIK
ncbi:MAG: VOC family protein [Clostridia bacterium]|nr:VOC family protein [Clostridia bacterium]